MASAECPRCHKKIKETSFSGHGVITTFTTIRYPPQGFENEAPYTVALIDLENGPRVIGRVEGDRNLKIGQHVAFAREMNGVLSFIVST